VKTGSEPLDAPQAEVERLLAPVAPRAFFRKTWERGPRVIRGKKEKFQWLGLGPGFFWELLRVAPPEDVRASRVDAQNVEHQEAGLASSQWAERFAAGSTLCVSRIDRLHAPLRQACVALKRAAGLAGAVRMNGYLSPDQAGFGIHYDDQSVFILQLEGAKRWHYGAAPEVAHPWGDFAPGGGPGAAEYAQLHGRDALPAPDLECLEVTTLTPGDVLYLPPGTWHRAFGNGESCALTLTCAPRRFPELLDVLVRRTLGRDAAWRSNAPPVASAEATVALPEAVEAWMRGNLKQLRRLVARLTPEDLHLLWRTALSEYELPEPDHAVSSERSRGRLVPATRLRAPHPLSHVSWGKGAAAATRVFSLNRHVDIEGELRSFFTRLCAKCSFTASEALRWSGRGARYAWEDVAPLLETLVDADFLRVEVSGSGRHQLQHRRQAQ
jgi:ribosomal protein L16 Arg81 hydroxylase